MADTKISGLTAAGVAALANEFAINEAGASKKLTLQQIKDLLSPVYTISFTGPVTWSPVDSTTYYSGIPPVVPTTTNAIRKVYIRRNGIIRVAEMYTYANTAGSSEAWSLYVRVNDTTDTLIATVSVSTNERVFSNSTINLPVSAGDFIELKWVCPAWATNPINVQLGGYLLVE
jgi:hypothetical protein